MAIKWTDATPALQLARLPQAAMNRPQGLVDVWIPAEVDRQVMDHLRQRDVEQGGLLVGEAFADARSDTVAHIRILGSAAADDSQGTALSLRMGSGVWQAAQSLLSPGQLILGWYHSHPGLSAFFSDTDRQTQRAFFSHSYSIGWVIDPINGEEALFLGGDCTAVRRGPDALATSGQQLWPPN